MKAPRAARLEGAFVVSFGELYKDKPGKSCKQSIFCFTD